MCEFQLGYKIAITHFGKPGKWSVFLEYTFLVVILSVRSCPIRLVNVELKRRGSFVLKICHFKYGTRIY